MSVWQSIKLGVNWWIIKDRGAILGIESLEVGTILDTPTTENIEQDIIRNPFVEVE